MWPGKSQDHPVPAALITLTGDLQGCLPTISPGTSDAGLSRCSGTLFWKLADAGSAVFSVLVPFGSVRFVARFAQISIKMAWICLNNLNYLAGFTLSADWFQPWRSDLSGRSSTLAALAQTEKRWTLSEVVSPVFHIICYPCVDRIYTTPFPPTTVAGLGSIRKRRLVIFIVIRVVCLIFTVFATFINFIIIIIIIIIIIFIYLCKLPLGFQVG